MRRLLILLMFVGIELQGKVRASDVVKAAARGEVNQLKKYLNDGGDVNSTIPVRNRRTLEIIDDNGITALMYAAYNGQLGSVKTLLEYGANKELKSNLKWQDGAFVGKNSTAYDFACKALPFAKRSSKTCQKIKSLLSSNSKKG